MAETRPWLDPPTHDDIEAAYHLHVGADIVGAGKDDGSEFELADVTTVLDDAELSMVERIVKTLWSRRR